MNSLVLMLVLFGQVPLPSELDGRMKRLDEMAVGEKVRVYSNALVVDFNGRTWLRGDWVISPGFEKHKELEVIHNRLGYIVRVHAVYHLVNGYKVPKHPTWKHSRAIFPGSIPVVAITVVQPYRTRSSIFSQWDAEYSNPNYRVRIPGTTRSGAYQWRN